MKHRNGRRRGFAVVTGIAALALAAACGSSDSGGGKGAGGEGHFTLEEVQDGAGDHNISAQCYTVPKTFEEPITLGFINPNVGFPFFKSWSDGYKAAAEFYGVDLYEADLGEFKFEDTLSKYEELSVRSPQVIGTLNPDGRALVERAAQDDVKVVPIDIPIEGNDYFVGVQNEEAGKLAGQALVDGVQDDLAGWAERDVLIVGLQQETVQPTVERTAAAVDVASASIPDASVDLQDLGAAATADDGLRVMTDYLTAHPNEVLLVVAMNDEVGVGALQAIKSAGRTDEVRMVSLGGDEAGRDALRSDEGVIVGLVDFNPFAEGWCWVESAIAVQLGDQFDPYSVTQVITRENVGELYPE